MINCEQIFINILLQAYVLKISLYDGVFSHSQIPILLIGLCGFGLFCCGFVSVAKNEDLHSRGPVTYILGAGILKIYY